MINLSPVSEEPRRATLGGIDTCIVFYHHHCSLNPFVLHPASNFHYLLLAFIFSNSLKALLLGPHLSVCLMKYLSFLSMLQNNNSILRHEMDLDPQHFPWDSLSWEEESFIISRGKRCEQQKREFYSNSWCLSAVRAMDGAGVPQGLQEALPVVVSV